MKITIKEILDNNFYTKEEIYKYSKEEFIEIMLQDSNQRFVDERIKEHDKDNELWIMYMNQRGCVD